jgi:hypothetical protein
MKKFVIGCLVVLVILAVIAGVLGYLAYDRLYRPVRQFATNVQHMVEIEKDVKNTSTFTAPDSGELTEQMVSRFVKVQQTMQARMGKRMDDLKATYDQLDKTLKSEDRKPSFSESMGALRDLAGLIVDAKQAQVDALNQQAFSLQEYEWVRGQVYAAAGLSAVGMDVKKLAEQAASGTLKGLPSPEKVELGDVPARNKALVAPYEKQLKDWAPFAYFGF